MGSVIPVSIEVNAAESNKPPATFFFSERAQVYIANAAPGKPNIIKGNFPLIKRQASTEKRVVFGDASSAKKMFCAPSDAVRTQENLQGIKDFFDQYDRGEIHVEDSDDSDF